MANMLVETLAGDFVPEEFEDDYAEAVEALVKTKIEGGEIKRTPTSTKSSGEVVDLLAALQRSVDAAKTSRGEDTEVRGGSRPRRPRRRRRGQEGSREEGTGEEDRGQEGSRQEDGQEGRARKTAARKAS